LRMETKPPRVTGFEDFTLLIKCWPFECS
jgi:hypothetical protein